jgi:hypothetical protein
VAELDAIFSEKADWLEALPHYQRDPITELLNKGKDPQEVAQLWLTISGPSNTAPYGVGAGFASVFYEKLLDELEKFFCDDPEYSEQRREIVSGLGKGRTYVVVAIAAAIAPHLGASEKLLAPAIALILLAATNIGVKAGCEALSEVRKKPQVP